MFPVIGRLCCYARVRTTSPVLCQKHVTEPRPRVVVVVGTRYVYVRMTSFHQLLFHDRIV
jgi:hypothetical protein